MKNILLVLPMLLVMNANASETAKYQHPSAAEIASSRACFAELESRGCGKSEEDHEHFRSCVSQIQDTLDDSCKKLVTNLYGDN